MTRIVDAGINCCGGHRVEQLPPGSVLVPHSGQLILKWHDECGNSLTYCNEKAQLWRNGDRWFVTDGWSDTTTAPDTWKPMVVEPLWKDRLRDWWERLKT